MDDLSSRRGDRGRSGLEKRDMSENPYEPLETETAEQNRSQKRDSNIRELFGIAESDFWYYPGFALMIAALNVSNVWYVLLLFALSTMFLIVYLNKSFPKCLKSTDLHSATKIYGLCVNVFLVTLQVVAISWKSWMLLM